MHAIGHAQSHDHAFASTSTLLAHHGQVNRACTHTQFVRRGHAFVSGLCQEASAENARVCRRAVALQGPRAVYAVARGSGPHEAAPRKRVHAHRVPKAGQQGAPSPCASFPSRTSSFHTPSRSLALFLSLTRTLPPSLKHSLPLLRPLAQSLVVAVLDLLRQR
eukprot:4913663-Pleurochrysis_carterae.AAC.1